MDIATFKSLENKVIMFILNQARNQIYNQRCLVLFRSSE